MAIEGPLRELGIHDVFQLLDLSRKTGALRVTSDLRDDEGGVLFDGGRVIHASVRSHPTSIERILRQAGKVSDADLVLAQALEPEEGEQAIAALLAGNSELRRAPIDASEVAGLSEIVTPDGDLRTLPCHMPNADPRLGGLDGFYAARLIKS